jgi:hypothetical protein
VSTSPRRSSNNSPDAAAGKVELTFSSVPTLPMLELPKGNADSFNGKYDYSIAVDKPFAFDTPSDEERTCYSRLIFSPFTVVLSCSSRRLCGCVNVTTQ